MGMIPEFPSASHNAGRPWWIVAAVCRGAGCAWRTKREQSPGSDLPV